MRKTSAAADLLLLAGPALAQSPAPIRIGVPIGLSGANSVVAPSVVQASELAVAEINAKGGVLGRPLELEVADDGSGAAGAQRAFACLVWQKKVDVLIAMETSAARPAGPGGDGAQRQRPRPPRGNGRAHLPAGCVA